MTTTQPPMGGAGSGVDAWRAYAAAEVSDSPAESWAEMSRDDIIETLRLEGVLTDEPAAADVHPNDDPMTAEREEYVDSEAAERAAALAEAREADGPQWMVPTVNGPVPEVELLARERLEQKAKRERDLAARKAQAAKLAKG